MAISDTLFEAIDQIDTYLRERGRDGAHFYDGAIRPELIALRNEMELMRARLDAPPGEKPFPILFTETPPLLDGECHRA